MKRNKTLQLLTALSASGALLLAGCNIGETPDYGQTSSEVVSSATLSVSADTVNLDPGDSDIGAEVTLTLTLSDSSFAFSAAEDANLSGYITIKGLDSDGNEVSTLSTGKILAKEAFEAGATSISVYTTVYDSGDSDVTSGSLKVSVSGGALNASGKTTTTGGDLEVATCSVVATSSSAENVTVSDGVFSFAAGASYADSLTLTLTPMGLSEGFVYTGSDNTEIDYTVIGKDGSETGALGTGTATATANSDGTIKIVLTGTSAASVISNNGTFVFKIPYTDLKIDTDSDGTADKDFATYYNLDDSGVRSFTTTAAVWSINGLALNLSGDGIDTAAAGYGTVDATVTTGAITITKDSSITVTGLSGVDSADDSITFTGTANGDGTYTLSLTKDLASSDDNLSGTIKVYIAATVGETSYNVEADETAEYSLTYLSYLAAPSGSQVVAATGGDTSATVYTTVLNLAAFDSVNDTSVSAANALSAGDTVATGTIGETEVTAVAVSAVSAGDTEIPVKIEYSGDAPTGKVTLTTADGVATSNVTATQTDIAHFATLSFVQDFDSLSAITDVVTVQDSTNTVAALSSGDFTLAGGGTVSLTSNAWSYKSTGTNANKGNRISSMSLTCPSSGSYAIEFDALLAPSANGYVDYLKIGTVARTNSNNTNYLLLLTGSGVNASTTGESLSWTLNGTSTTTVNLVENVFYHYKLDCDITAGTVLLTITKADGTVILSNEELTINGTSYQAVQFVNDIHTYSARLDHIIDNVVVYITK